MQPRIEETIVIDFVTSSPTTGAATDADSAPTCKVREDSSDTPILTPTVTKRTGEDGVYRVAIACTTANGFESLKSYNVLALATVGGVAGKAIIGSFQVRPDAADLILVTPANKIATDVAGNVSVLGEEVEIPTADELGDIYASRWWLHADSVALDADVTAIKAKTNNLPASFPTNFATLGINASGHISRVTLTDTLTTYTGNTPQTGDSFARIGANGASLTSLSTQASVNTLAGYVDTEVAAIKLKTDGLPASFPANFASLGINASGYISRVVLADTLTTYTGNTVQTGDSFARIGATGSGLTSLASQASVNTVIGYVDTEVATIAAGVAALPSAAANLAAWKADSDVAGLLLTGDKLESMIEAGIGGGIYRYTGASLINAPAFEGEVGTVTIDLGQPLVGGGTIGDALVASYTNLNATVGSRATPAQVNAEADQALLDVGLTLVKTAFLDATISSRSTYSGGDTAGTITLLGRLTSGRAINLDNLDATVSTRASAATALSTAVWTNTKAGYLDASISGVSTGGVTASEIAEAVLALIDSDPEFATLLDVGGFLDTMIEADPANPGSFRLTEDGLSAMATGNDTPGTTTLLSRLTAGRATNLDNLDAAVSTRSTYAGADTSGVTTLLSRLTAGRATNLDNLDAAVSTRSIYAGADTPGTTTVLSRLTADRATKLDNIDASVSSRSTFSGGAVASVTGPVTVGTNNDKTNYSLAITPPTASQNATAVWADAAAAELLNSIDVLLDSIVSLSVAGSVNQSSPAANAFNGNSSLNTANNFYNGFYLVFTNGANDKVARRVTNYVGSGRSFTFEVGFPFAPANSDTFRLLGRSE